MKLEIIPLASKKIKLRKIPLEWFNETVSKPEQVVEGYAGRKVAQRIYHRKGKRILLRVVLEKDPYKNVVVTAYLTSQIEKYWRE